MAQNRDRNGRDRDLQRSSWQGGDDVGQGEHGSQGGFEEQQGGEWNRMGRYGEEGSSSTSQRGETGRFGQGTRAERDAWQSSGSGESWGGSAGSPSVGESSGGRYRSRDGADGMGSRGGYGSGSYGSGTYGTSPGSGYGSGYGYGSSGYGAAQRQGGEQRGEQRGLWDRASDEVSSWFGDDDARRRRDMDEHRGRGPKGYTRSDERIREDVNDRLTDDGWLDASDIEVEVSSSEVTLTGQVNSREEKRRAEDIADAISGVKHVQNNLRVKDRGAVSSQGSAMQPGSGSRSSS